ncbi:hypothetical protein [Terricaulis sp.]|uniref:hypothetical protein n=1 Tax=Terricaulis sp. TaxID=2768686 RepID=UPI003783DD6B
MRFIHAISALAFITLAACGQAAAPTEAEAQPAQGGGAQISAADRAALMRAMSVTPDAHGQVVNACEEKVTPQLVNVDLGGAVGTAVLAVIPGGPNTASCYGDGPGDMHLFRRTGSTFTEIHALTGAFLVVLGTSHAGVRDIVDGGPGMSHPVYWWNGSAYVQHGQIADSAMGDSAQIYPQ